MGIGDHCAVFGCDNTRRYPERYVIKEHVKTLKFHICSNKKHFRLWTRLLRRKNYKVTASTKICSNHFKYGEPFPVDPHPTLFLKGYVEPVTSRRQPLKRRASSQSTPQPKKKTRTSRFRSVGVQVDPVDIEVARVEYDHCYVQLPCKRTVFSSDYVDHLEDELHNLDTLCNELKNRLKEAKADVERLRQESRAKTKYLSITDICNSDELVKLYTGLPSYALFQWLFGEVKHHAINLHYYKGKASQVHKKYQKDNLEKPGPKRSQSLENEFLMTLMKLRLNLREEDLAFRFGVSESAVSQVVSTWVPFLDKELKPLIYWPGEEEILKYYPQCFHKYNGTVRCIIDCTEIQIERPTLAASNAQVYSQYKSRPTVKCLVGITPGGTISYISKPTGGNTSDKKLVKMTKFIDKLEPNDVLMADRGFNIQELLLHKNVKLVIPPFMRTTSSSSQFTESDDTRTKTVANARIHVERAIGRLKEFSILQGPIPLTMFDLMESVLVICSAIVNLQPVLVPLSS